MNQTHAGSRGVVLVIGMAALFANSPAARAQEVTAVAGGPFRNVPFIAQSSQFTAEFDATPTGTDNAGIGLSDDATRAFQATSHLCGLTQVVKSTSETGLSFPRQLPFRMRPV